MNRAEKTPKWVRDLQFWFRRARSRMPGRNFSRFGEQQIIDEYISILGLDQLNKTAVDIGAGDGIRGSNTYNLFLKGWSGLGIEFDEAKFERLKRAYRGLERVSACRSLVLPENIAPALVGYGIEKEFGVLSLDIDGNDFWVLDSILGSFRPKLIVTEFNEKIPPPIKFCVNFDPDFKLRHHFFGYSISKLSDLLEKHEYSLLRIEYNNAFLAPNDLPGVTGMAVGITEEYRRGYRDRPDRKEKFAENRDVEVLHSVSPEKACELLQTLYSKDRGNYVMEID